MYGNAFHPGRIFQGRNGENNYRRYPGAFGPANRNTYLLHTENVPLKPKVVTIVRNGAKPRSNVKILLNRRSVQSFEQLMGDISEAFGPKWKNNKVRKLFTTRGREVQGISDFFRDDDIFVGVGNEQLTEHDVLDIIEEIYPESPYAKNIMRDFERQKRKRLALAAQSKETDPDKRDSGFGEGSDGSNKDAEQDTVIYKGRPTEKGKRRNEYPRDMEVGMRLEREKEKAVQEEKDRSKKQKLKMMDSQRRALEDENRKGRLIPLKVEDPFKRMKEQKEKEKEEIRRRREEEKLRHEEEERHRKEKEKHDREMAENAARERQAAAERDRIEKEREKAERKAAREKEREIREREKQMAQEKEREKQKELKEKEHREQHKDPILADNKEKEQKESKDIKDKEHHEIKGVKDNKDNETEKIDKGKDGEKETDNKNKNENAKEVIKDNKEIEKERERRNKKKSKSKIVRKTKLERQISSDDYVLAKYELGRTLGDGNFAVVRIGKMKATGVEYAMKVIDKPKLKGKEHMVENEIEIMKDCNHQNIVKLYEEYETADKIYLVMELVKVGSTHNLQNPVLQIRS